MWDSNKIYKFLVIYSNDRGFLLCFLGYKEIKRIIKEIKVVDI